MNKRFIKVIDKKTAETLMKLGFQLVDDTNGFFTFLNTNKIKFSDEIDLKNIQYSNILTF